MATKQSLVFIAAIVLSLLASTVPSNSFLGNSYQSVSSNNTDSWATSAGGAGSDMAWDMVLDSSGNSYITGSFSGSATFGDTTLNSYGGMDGFVAKMNATGHWVWASHIYGTYEDWGIGIDIDGSGNIYVTGIFMDASGSTSPTTTLGSTSLSSHYQSSYDMFIAKLNNQGTFLWAKTSKKISNYNQNTGQDEEEFLQVIPTDIKYFNNSISVSGSYAGKTWVQTDSQGDWYQESTLGTADIWVGFLTPNGAWTSALGWGGNSNYDSASAIAVSPSGNYWYLAGNFEGTVEFPNGAMLSSSGGSRDIWIMMIDDAGVIQWVVPAGGSGMDLVRNLISDSLDSVYAIGEFDGSLSAFGNERLTSNAGGTDIWVGKVGFGGSWNWAKKGGGPSDDLGFSLSLSPDENTLFSSGQIAGMTTFENSATTLMANSSGTSDAVVALSSTLDGEWEKIFLAGGPSGGDRAWAVATDSQNITYSAGRFKGTISGPGEFGSDDLISSGDFDVFMWKGLVEDDDNDGVANENDDCPTVWGNATIPPFIGCVDSDGDGYSDYDDSHPNNPLEWNDSDGDLIGDNTDDCYGIWGNSTEDKLGCIDDDGDGWSNEGDSFSQEPTQWNDSDNDGFGDNWNDDNLTDYYSSLGLGIYVVNAKFMDFCPTLSGFDSYDNPGCPDTDRDGWSDVTDAFANNPTQHLDSDGDGWGDNNSIDATQRDFLPFDSTQYLDQDGDGWGDNLNGNNPDQFPLDYTQQTDNDSDGFGDNISGFEGDSCPGISAESWRDRFGCLDSDGDGSSDEGDLFPSDWSQWADSDGDGQGDNWINSAQQELRKSHWPGIYLPGGTNSDNSPLDFDNDGWEDENASNSSEPWDDCPIEAGTSWLDRIGCVDSDGDGWSDQIDVFPQDPGQWFDSDDDGFGDEIDDCPTLAGESSHDRKGCPDTDGDGWSDPMDIYSPYPWNTSQNADLFPADPSLWNSSQIKVDFAGSDERGMAIGLGIGALVTLLLVGAFVIFIMRGDEEEVEEEEDTNDESDSNQTDRAGQLARDWQEDSAEEPDSMAMATKDAMSILDKS
ncbi:MAG TPA: hypothetical protein EYQ73_02435 [Candidatus Poseidoniales archaeon]|nr:hypothetical protein [Candidatus Poseidoniales archaeon]HIL66027.1 hypothetical protein [Candidatus Poseidoniales archaeon]